MLEITSSMTATAPKTIKVTATISTCCNTLKAIRQQPQMPVATKIGKRHPQRLVTSPAKGEAKIEPMPTHNKSRPKVCSSKLKRVLMNGMSGAQAAIAKPAVRNETRFEMRAGVMLNRIKLIAGGYEGAYLSRSQA